MPFTFSAGSFSFLKSSTNSQPNIKQNNNVDNVNKNNNNVNDNLDMGNTPLAHPPLNNNINVIPLDRRVRSLDNSVSSRNNRRNSNASNQKNTTNRKVWYKSIFVRLHNTISRWNDDNYNDNDDSSSSSSGSSNNNNNNNNSNDNDCKDIIIENNNNNVVDGVTETGSLSGCDDGPIMMKSKRNIVAGDQENSFIYHGMHHDFYVVTKHGSIKNGHHVKDGSLTDGSLTDGSLTDGALKPSRSSPNFNGDEFKKIISSSVFEECAKTPRHSKEAEVLGKVGRFTIVREREDFDTTYFDQCHCQQKPCRFSKNGCSGTHPVLPPELFKENVGLPIRISQQQAAAIANHHAQMQMYNSYLNRNDSSTSKSRRSFYGDNTPSNSSRNSLPSLQKYNNGACPLPIMISKATTPNNPNLNPNSISNYSRVVLPHSSSSPNLVHLNQRSKFECAQNRNISKNNNGRPNANIIVGGNSGKYPNPPTDNGSYYPQKCNNNNNNNNINVTKKPKKSSLVNMNTTEEQQRRLSMPPTSTSTTPPLILNSSSTPSTPTTPSKFSLHPPNEPHTTINSHSGRKFEVEWNTTTKSSSSGSSSSSSSSETAYSPPSTISSVFSMASSPEKKSTVSTLSRRCSTLSSKCGRKFEVTILSSSSSPSNNCILNTSPHSTISVNSVVSSTADANMESTKC